MKISIPWNVYSLSEHYSHSRTFSQFRKHTGKHMKLSWNKFFAALTISSNLKTKPCKSVQWNCPKQISRIIIRNNFIESFDTAKLPYLRLKLLCNSKNISRDF